MVWANLTTPRDSLRTGYRATIVDYNKMNKLSRPNNRRRTIGPNCLKVVETKTQALSFHLIKVEVGDCNRPISPHTSTASNYQWWRQQNLTAKRLTLPKYKYHSSWYGMHCYGLPKCVSMYQHVLDRHQDMHLLRNLWSDGTLYATRKWQHKAKITHQHLLWRETLYSPQLPPMRPLGLVPPTASPHCCLARLGTDYIVQFSNTWHYGRNPDCCNAPFVTSSKGHPPSNKVQILDNCDDLGIAIWPCA